MLEKGRMSAVKIASPSPDVALEMVSRIPGGSFVSEDSSFSLRILETQEPSEQLGRQQPLGQGLVSVGSSVCRICHTNTVREPLISPCRCKGTLAFVHLSCLERWLNQSCRSYCELCRYRFNAVETPRYRWHEALRIWVSHPRNRRHIQSDLLILTLLTVVTLGLVAVCLLGIRYFVIEGKKIGISRTWTKGAISFFLTIVVLGYVTTVYLLIKDQISPWYRWWKNTVNVRLVMENEEPWRTSSLESLPDRDTQTTPSSRTPEEKIGDSDDTGI